MKKYKPRILFMEARENLFGHKRQNEAIINVLSEIAELTIVFPSEWFQTIPQNVKYYQFTPDFICKKENFAQIIKSLQCMKFAKSLDQKMHFDCIFFASYNIYAMVLSRLMFRKHCERVYILHHNISDQLDVSLSKRICFSLFKKKTKHILIEDFIRNSFIQKQHVPDNLTYFFPHQLNIEKQSSHITYDYTGISNSNDEKWIKKIIAEERKTSILKNTGIRILLRSVHYEYDNGFLTVFKGILDEQKYYKIIMESRVILIPFPKEFRYRISGSVADAFSNEKRVIGSNIPLIKKYHDDYPHICKTGVQIHDIIKDYNNKEKYETICKKEFNQYKASHSYEAFKDAFRKIFINDAGV